MERKNERLPIFTERFRELQGKQSNTEFAEFLGISRQTVGFYWNGDRVPDAVTLIKIAKSCDVSADWLLGLSHIKSRDTDVAKVAEYTGLSESAIEFLHSVHDDIYHMEVISRMISHEFFPEMIDYMLEMRNAKMEDELIKLGDLSPMPRIAAGGGRIIRGLERVLFLEHVIDGYLNNIAGKIAQDMFDKERDTILNNNRPRR